MLFKATEMYRVSRAFAEAINANVLGQKRITDQLREYETLNIINMTRTSDGYREGTYLQLSMLDEGSLLLQSVGAQRFQSTPTCASKSSVLSITDIHLQLFSRILQSGVSDRTKRAKRTRQLLSPLSSGDSDECRRCPSRP